MSEQKETSRMALTPVQKYEIPIVKSGRDLTPYQHKGRFGGNRSRRAPVENRY